MNRILKVISLLALAVVSFCVYSGAQATPEATSTNHVLKGTYITNAQGVIDITAKTLTDIGPTLTVSCPGTTGTCTVQADLWIKVNGPSTSGNYIFLCFTVDGSETSGCTESSGETASDGSAMINSTSLSTSGVAAGTHSVQMLFYAYDASVVDYYNATYRVYKP
ncbi:MAG: hypothetical protein ABSA80_19380 [Terriglobales bacterium]|jgi:hypothetical protein